MDVERLRRETPGCLQRIHLNNAGASMMPEPVLKAVRSHWELEAEIGGYEAERERAAEILESYRAVADLVRARPENIAFAENATAAFAQALSSIPFQRGDAILTTRNDYNSNQIMYLSLARRLGIEVVRAPDRPEGGVDAGALAELARRRRPKLVAVTHVPTNSGLVQPIEPIGRVCRELGLWYLVDACQSVGQMPVDAGAIGCDFLSATSRKFLRGPRGSGFLFVSDRVLQSELEPMFIDVRGADWTEADAYRRQPTARRFENWEFPWALVLGTGAAARYALKIGLAEIQERVRRLAALLRDRLGRIPGARVLDRGPELCAIVTVHRPGLKPDALRAELFRRGINASVSTRGGAVIDMDDKKVDWALRLSPHYYNTEEEIDRAAAAVASV